MDDVLGGAAAWENVDSTEGQWQNQWDYDILFQLGLFDISMMSLESTLEGQQCR